MRTSIDIPDPLFRRAKKLAQERGLTLRQMVIDGLRGVVERSDGRTRTTSEKDCSFGGDGLVEGLSWTDWDRIRDLCYGGGDE
jgi:hypothetical protein